MKVFHNGFKKEKMGFILTKWSPLTFCEKAFQC